MHIHIYFLRVVHFCVTALKRQNRWTQASPCTVYMYYISVSIQTPWAVSLIVSAAAEHTLSVYIIPPLCGPLNLYMLFVGLIENALSKKHFCYNLFGVRLCTELTINQPQEDYSDAPNGPLGSNCCYPPLHFEFLLFSGRMSKTEHPASKPQKRDASFVSIPVHPSAYRPQDALGVLVCSTNELKGYSI